MVWPVAEHEEVLEKTTAWVVFKSTDKDNTKPAFICPKSTTETSKHCVKSVQSSQ